MLARVHRGIAGALARRAGLRHFRFFAGALAAEAGAPGHELRLLGDSDVLALCEDPELELEAGRVRAALGRGDVCAASFAQGRLAGYCWYAFSPLPHLDGVWVEFPPDTLWIYKSFVRPSARGRGHAPALYRFAGAAGTPRGRRGSLICVEAHNRASIAAAMRSGHSPAGHAVYRSRNGSLQAWYSPKAREQGLSFRAVDCALDTFSMRGQS